MKTILEFELPDESVGYTHAMSGSKYHAVLWETLCVFLRNEIKLGQNEDRVKVLKEVRQFMIDELAEKGVDVHF